MHLNEIIVIVQNRLQRLNSLKADAILQGDLERAALLEDEIWETEHTLQLLRDAENGESGH